MKHLFNFKTIADYNAVVEGLDLPNVCAVDEGSQVFYNDYRRFAPYILYSDFSKSKSIIPGKTPIAIEVVPKSHMADGKSRWMSLVNMSLQDPENGTTAVGNNSSTNPGAGIKWGHYNYAIPGLSDYRTNIPFYTPDEEYDWDTLSEMTVPELKELLNSIKLGSNVVGSDTYGYIPYDHNIRPYDEDGKSDPNYPYYYPTSINRFDTNTYLICNYVSIDSESGLDESSFSKYVHSPFNNDGSRNERYSANNPNGSLSPLSEFNGFDNTDKIIAAVTGDAWKSGAIDNSKHTQGYAPAACACRRFRTEGTLPGDWYLGALGELGYIIPNLSYINQVLGLLGAKAVQIGDYNTADDQGLGNWLWSSSVYSGNSSWNLGSSDGYCSWIGRYGSGSNGRVRAFLAY